MSLARNLAWWCVRNEVIWSVLNRTVLRVARYVDWARSEVDRLRMYSVDEAPRSVGGRAEASLLSRAFPDMASTLEVQRGPFRGLLYPSRRAVGSELAPKLLGFYEWEIQPLIERSCAMPYVNVVDVGSAEGYYAVGIARRLPAATVYAFDVDPEAERLCEEMARLNGVDERVVVRGACGPQDLVQLVASGRTLIISDCEGFERDLFTPEIIPALARHDLLVECHDFLQPGVAAELRERFARSHLAVTVMTVPDESKPELFTSATLAPFDRAERRRLLSEHRPSEMVWLYLTPRDSSA